MARKTRARRGRKPSENLGPVLPSDGSATWFYDLVGVAYCDELRSRYRRGRAAPAVAPKRILARPPQRREIISYHLPDVVGQHVPGRPWERWCSQDALRERLPA